LDTTPAPVIAFDTMDVDFPPNIGGTVLPLPRDLEELEWGIAEIWQPAIACFLIVRHKGTQYFLMPSYNW